MGAFSSIKIGDIDMSQNSISGVTVGINKTVTTGTYNSLLADKPIIYLDCSGGNIVINGLSGGVNGQTVDLVKKTLAGQVTLAHNNTSGTQKIMNVGNANFQSTANNYMNKRLICDGTNWYSN